MGQYIRRERSLLSYVQAQIMLLSIGEQIMAHELHLIGPQQFPALLLQVARECCLTLFTNTLHTY